MALVAQSDWIIDIGPGAEDEGGKIVACGTPRDIVSVAEGRTAPYLARSLA
jgi:excinuclease ABC subunit A